MGSAALDAAVAFPSTVTHISRKAKEKQKQKSNRQRELISARGASHENITWYASRYVVYELNERDILLWVFTPKDDSVAKALVFNCSLCVVV